MNFESARNIEKKRQDLKAAREQYLEKAKAKYERDERKAELAKQRGEDSWMLPAISDRVEREEQNVKKSKKKKKEKKKKKHKKKEKKKKRKDSSSSSDSSSDEDEGPQWVEKSASKAKTAEMDAGPAVKGPQLQRDSWMEAPIDLFPTVTRKELIDKKNKEKEEMEKAKQLMERPGLHVKELNPYWKDGGTGLPEDSDAKRRERDKGNLGPGDGGLSWLRKAYERCVEQAKEEGRSLEEMAAERWGSLEKVQKMIKDAEASVGRGARGDRQRGGFMKPGEGRSGSKMFQRPRSRSNSPVRKSYSNQDRNRSRTSDNYSDRNTRDSRSRSRDRKRRSRSRSRSQERRQRSHSNERRRRSRSRSGSRDRRQRRSRSRSREKQRYRERSPASDRSRSGLSSLKGRFMKPGEMSEGSTTGSSRKSSASAPAWKKKEFHKPREEDRSSDDDRRRGRDERRKDGHRRRRSSSSSSESSSSDSSSERSSSESEAEGQRSRSPQVEVKILSEKEMNDLGAKILRMEIMGNKEQAEKLKAQLEAAREAKKNAPAAAASGQTGSKRQGAADDDDDFVTLTKTDRSGLARPIPDRQHPDMPRGGRRRKKQKVETHTGKTGERTKYFDDDDKFDLKTMVEREKLGTAEDQNQMFARLAGRAAEKTNDDFQVDDIFLSKANQKQSDSIQEERERAVAIFEHRKMASALQKCNFCFNNVKKHMIVAIGTKAYLCLPETKSLTEGHCLIVPMQHTQSGTAVDEDVWSEMQVFRKCLTKMFAERDEDVVFMETSMHLKSFPHMSLHCVPMEREIGELAPIYFKKAIQESESEWSQNKKLVDLRNKDIRHAVPKGFPYFAVDFGYQGGFAHVIEDEHKFPKYFGQEIIGGMIDADHQLWRKPPRENFDDQRKKVLRFAEMWKPHDWTKNIAKKTETDSDSD